MQDAVYFGGGREGTMAARSSVPSRLNKKASNPAVLLISCKPSRNGAWVEWQDKTPPWLAGDALVNGSEAW